MSVATLNMHIMRCDKGTKADCISVSNKHTAAVNTYMDRTHTGNL